MPIKKGHDTHINVGLLQVSISDVWRLYDETGQVFYTSGNKPENLALPLGKYLLEVGDNRTQVIVGATTLPVTEPPLETEQWVIINPTPEDKNPRSSEQGLLELVFPYDNSWEIKISGNGNPGIILKAADYTISDQNRKINNAGTTPSYSLAPGNYDILLNKVPIQNVPIKKGRKTRIKAGNIRLNFTYVLSDAEMQQWLPHITKFTWYLKNELKTLSYRADTGSTTFVVPVGVYHLELAGPDPEPLGVGDKLTTKLDIPLTVLTVLNPNKLYWKLRDFSHDIITGGPNQTSKVLAIPPASMTVEASPPGEHYVYFIHWGQNTNMVSGGYKAIYIPPVYSSYRIEQK